MGVLLSLQTAGTSRKETQPVPRTGKGRETITERIVNAATGHPTEAPLTKAQQREAETIREVGRQAAHDKLEVKRGGGNPRAVGPGDDAA